MKRSTAVIVVPPIVGVLLLSVILFWPTVSERIIAPIAQTSWLLLRILVLSIDQRIYWGGLVVIIAFAILLRILQRTDPRPPILAQQRNRAMSRLEDWRRLFAQTPKYDDERTEIQQELLDLLVHSYALHQHLTPDFHVTEAFRRREIPLPENLYALLFPATPEGHDARRSILQRKRSRRETERYHRSVEECLAFLENYTAGGE